MKSWPFAPLLIFVGITGGGLLAPEAHSTPSQDYVRAHSTEICGILDGIPGINTVDFIGEAIVHDTGMSWGDAGDIIRAAVLTVCPWNQRVMDQYTAMYSPKPVFKTGAVGGTVG